MTVYRHVLRGCSPTPLAHYLKALGILRLVGEQADKDARGWWDGELFCLLTTLTKEELEKFFLERYEPTPVFNPWGGRSGYYPGSSEKTARNALMAIESSTHVQLAQFRESIALLRSVVEGMGGAKPDKVREPMMLSRIKNSIRGSGADWLATVVAELGDRYSKPAIFGSGGNEGSGSYTAAFLAAIVECIIRRGWNEAIAPCLWSECCDRDSWNGDFQPPSDDSSKKAKKEAVAGPFRQFLPGATGSPWDLLLTFEGAITIQSGVSRRSNSDQDRFLASPFYFATVGIGAGSSSERDEFAVNNGKKNAGRGEQWFPLWNTPSTFGEIRRLFREGRCSVGRRAAKTPLDAARAICGLGTSRGIGSFLRYGYLQRDNLATHFAVPLGRIEVRENSTARLVDDIAGWLARLHRLARNKNAPARFILAERHLANAVFDALTHDHTPARWQAILLAATDIEAIQVTGTAIEANPIPQLRPDWVTAVNDHSAEVRLALALGSAAAFFRRGRPADPVRHHWLPLDAGARRFKTADNRPIKDSRVVVSGRDSVRDLAAIVERRLIESEDGGQRRSGLIAAPRCGARLDDLAHFLAGEVDLDRLLGLARAFMALRWDTWKPEFYPAPKVPESTADSPGTKQLRETPGECWLAVRLACLPWKLTPDKDIPADPRMVRLLSSGDAGRALETACRRLRSAGIRPPMQAGVTDRGIARLWAAALAFPISHSTALKCLTRLDPRLDPKKGMQNA